MRVRMDCTVGKEASAILCSSIRGDINYLSAGAGTFIW